jgi:hypothetical protein
VDQAPARPAVTAGERVDGLELGVGNRSLNNSGQGLIVVERAEIREQVRHTLWRRGNERCRTWIVLAAANPVPPVPQPARVCLVPGIGHEPAAIPVPGVAGTFVCTATVPARDT